MSMVGLLCDMTTASTQPLVSCPLGHLYNNTKPKTVWSHFNNGMRCELYKTLDAFVDPLTLTLIQMITNFVAQQSSFGTLLIIRESNTDVTGLLMSL